MDTRSLSLVHAIVEILGRCHTAALRSVDAISALLEVAEQDVLLALLLLEHDGLVERVWCPGVTAWRLRSDAAPVAWTSHDAVAEP